ncbi:MAG: hypothetical protein Q7K40_02460 [bacterium]|nr:hypothetical protein [bacterium]
MNAEQQVLYKVQKIRDINALAVPLNGFLKEAPFWKISCLWIWKIVLTVQREMLTVKLMSHLHSEEARKFENYSYVLLYAGDALLRAEKFERAEECFNRIFKIEAKGNQDILLSARMGKLECRIEIARSRMKRDDRIVFSGSIEKDFLALIRKDVFKTSSAIQQNIRSRLGRADMNISVLTIRSETAHAREVYQRSTI